MSPPIHMVAGENIPYIQDAFSSLGRLTFLPGRSITASDLQETQVLLIRSITRVDETLLKGTPVEFVGSASAGVDHIDQAYLKARHIGFASAAGSNANSVAEYVIAALFHLEQHHGISLRGKTIGIVGVGNIGRLVKGKVEALGMRPILHDPPLAETGLLASHSLEETLGCDVVTLHTPFTTGGPYPTYHLINEQTLKWMTPSTILINAARGEVVDTKALLDAISHRRLGHTIIDVWENEPDIPWDLFQAVTIGTPHIAGHSLDGKANGTFMIYQAVCKHLGVTPVWNPAHSLPPPVVPTLEFDIDRITQESIPAEAVSGIYDLKADYLRMDELLQAPAADRPKLFDGLRKNYPVRREFETTRLILPGLPPSVRTILTGIGFSNITGK